MSIQYTLLGFELTTFGTWVSFHIPLDQGSRPTVFFSLFSGFSNANFAGFDKGAESDHHHHDSLDPLVTTTLDLLKLVEHDGFGIFVQLEEQSLLISKIPWP